MEYDIIEKVAGLAAGNHGDELPEVAARLLMDAFSFDFCGVYTWNDETGLFTLRASCGDESNCVHGYSDGEGVPGLVRERMAPVLFGPEHTPPGAPRTGQPFDCGLDGFESAAAYPLIGGTAFWGVLYFKSRRAAG